MDLIRENAHVQKLVMLPRKNSCSLDLASQDTMMAAAFRLSAFRQITVPMASVSTSACTHAEGTAGNLTLIDEPLICAPELPAACTLQKSLHPASAYKTCMAVEVAGCTRKDYNHSYGL